MSSNVKYIQNNNNFLHGVRGIVYLDGDVAGAVQDISATESGEEDIVYAMGSRYPQAKEIKNKIVNGTIKSLVFDPSTQKLMKLSDPTSDADVLNGDRDFDDITFDNRLTHEATQMGFHRSGDEVIGALIPMFDIQVLSHVVDSTLDANENNVNAGVVTKSGKSKGFKIHGCIIKSYEIMFNKDTFWLANVEFVADKMTRMGDNNPTAGL